MKQVPASPLNYEFSRHLEPRAEIESGETILVEAEDALSGQIRTNNDRRDKSKVPFGNPVAGPIYVKDAKPGDAIAVTIHEIQPRDNQAATYTGHPRMLSEWLGTDVPHGAHVCPIDEEGVHFSDDITIPYAPMLGCIGTAPDWGVPSTGPSGPHGGNMDIIETCPGSTVYLPVFVEGAYLYLGDAHANMGHGELSATGLEMASITKITVDLIPGKQLACPRIESATEIITIGIDHPLTRAIAFGYAQLILWLEEDYGWNRWKAYDILTHVGQISIGYYRAGTAGTKISKQYANAPSK